MGHNSFTLAANGLLRALKTQASICHGFDPAKPPSPYPKLVQFEGVWDTGATGSVISQKVVDDCGLKPIGMARVHTAGGECNCEVYLINILLPNQVGFPNVRVTKADMGGTDVLIGMDIISTGDFALTHKDGKTCFSFRQPSLVRIDFVEAEKLAAASKVDSYAPCPCGSGRKFKYCCKALY